MTFVTNSIHTSRLRLIEARHTVEEDRVVLRTQGVIKSLERGPHHHGACIRFDHCPACMQEIEFTGTLPTTYSTCIYLYLRYRYLYFGLAVVFPGTTVLFNTSTVRLYVIQLTVIPVLIIISRFWDREF